MEMKTQDKVNVEDIDLIVENGIPGVRYWAFRHPYWFPMTENIPDGQILVVNPKQGIAL
jgi:hypothetical protein